MNRELLQTGDQVFHPVYGSGVVLGRTKDQPAGQTTDYYAVRLADGAILSVPVDRAEALGLRPVLNSVATIVACLRTPAQPLPNAPLMRSSELRSRWRAPQPDTVTQTVRDLLARPLTPNDIRWLAKALERLSIEAAVVDEINPDEARAAIQHEIDRLKSN